MEAACSEVSTSLRHCRVLEEIRGWIHTRFDSDGSVAGLSPLFDGGFNIFHGKANLLGENAGKHSYIPAISLDSWRARMCNA